MTIAYKLHDEAEVLGASDIEAENIRWLNERGVSVSKLAHIRGKIQSGRYINDREWEMYDLFTDAFCGGVCRTDIERVLASTRIGA